VESRPEAPALFYHASADMLAPGTVVRGRFQLLQLERQLYESILGTAEQPGELAKTMLRHMRASSTPRSIGLNGLLV
jgi:hypothetical protein